jgi:hypothetical protein
VVPAAAFTIIACVRLLLIITRVLPSPLTTTCHLLAPLYPPPTPPPYPTHTHTPPTLHPPQEAKEREWRAAERAAAERQAAIQRDLATARETQVRRSAAMCKRADKGKPKGLLGSWSVHRRS